MKHLIALTATALIASTAAFADSKPSADEVEKIKATLAAWGCEGGEFEKEDEGTGVYEIDDAKCADGQQYDIKLDSGFKLTSMTRD